MLMIVLSFIGGFILSAIIISLLRVGSECDVDMLMFYLQNKEAELQREKEMNEYLKRANEELQDELNKIKINEMAI